MCSKQEKIEINIERKNRIVSCSILYYDDRERHGNAVETDGSRPPRVSIADKDVIHRSLQKHEVL